jgi:hypothetical protein
MPALLKFSSNVDKVLASLDAVKKARLAYVFQTAAEVGLQALADAQTISPVDTGLYRAAHDLTINEPSGYDPTTDSSLAAKAAAAGIPLSVAMASASTASAASPNLDPQAQIGKALERLEAGRASFTGTMTIFLTNNLQYAWALENGSSQQAPEGVYGIVRQRAVANLKAGGLL